MSEFVLFHWRKKKRKQRKSNSEQVEKLRYYTRYTLLYHKNILVDLFVEKER